MLDSSGRRRLAAIDAARPPAAAAAPQQRDDDDDLTYLGSLIEEDRVGSAADPHRLRGQPLVLRYWLSSTSTVVLSHVRRMGRREVLIGKSGTEKWERGVARKFDAQSLTAAG